MKTCQCKWKAWKNSKTATERSRKQTTTLALAPEEGQRSQIFHHKVSQAALVTDQQDLATGYTHTSHKS
jgi:hypothetical protein